MIRIKRNVKQVIARSDEAALEAVRHRLQATILKRFTSIGDAVEQTRQLAPE